MARIYSKRNRHRQGRMGRCHCYRAGVYTIRTHTVAQHRLMGYDVELQEAEDPVTLGERCVGRRVQKWV